MDSNRTKADTKFIVESASKRVLLLADHTFDWFQPAEGYVVLVRS